MNGSTKAPSAPTTKLAHRVRFAGVVVATVAILLIAISPLLGRVKVASAAKRATSIAFGSINNFDTVNDTGSVCHGFEIEIDDIHSKDVTYTYDWNHYGVPKITEDNADPLHPKVFIRYESAKNADGSWASFTAIPAGPISPTDGHQFTNPSVNFGGEHFGVGYYGAPTSVKYSWLKDDGAGNLTFAGAVNISTPTFAYAPPVGNAPAQVQAAIVPPPPPAAPAKEFGEPSWVKVTVTQTHNNQKVELRDLVSDDPNDPNDRNWKNGEPDEVEVEWQLIQTEFNKVDGGKNGKMEGAPEKLENGDEVITRRYDFYKYAGPIDEETGEALTDNVGPDDLHGVGDYADVVVVGDYVGAQMAGFDAAGQIGLIDHLQDGEVNVPYVERSIVIGGTAPVITTRTGPLPDGMTFDEITGVLSGTPTVAGTFTFTVHSTDANGGDVTNIFNLTITDSIIVEPPHSTITTISSPTFGGTTTGGGEYVNGELVTVLAVANPGFAFVNWTDGGTIVSSSATYEFVADVNRELVANFVALYDISTSASPSVGGSTSGGGTFSEGDAVTVIATANAGYSFVNWTEGGTEVSMSTSYIFPATANRNLVANFVGVTTNVTGQITVTRGKPVYNRITRRTQQSVTLTNRGGTIVGPVSLVLDRLSPSASLVNLTGTTNAQLPAGSPFVTAVPGDFAAGASAVVPLEFVNSSSAPIGYLLRVLAGPGLR